MASFDKEAFRKGSKSRVSASASKAFGGGGKGEYDFSIVAPKQLTSGTYYFRPLPPWPGRNPVGVVRHATHRLETVAGKDPLNIICPNKGRCMLCEIENELAGKADELSEEKRKHLKQLHPWERYLYACVIRAKPDPESTDKYPDWIPDTKTEKGMIFQVSGMGLKEDLDDTIMAKPSLMSPTKGRYLKLYVKRGKGGKGNKYEIMREMSKPCPIKDQSLFSDEKYPKLSEMFANSDYVKRLDSEEMVELWKRAWWTKGIRDLDCFNSSEEEEDDEEDAFEDEEDDEEEEETPRRKTKSKTVTKKKRRVEEDNDDEDEIEED